VSRTWTRTQLEAWSSHDTSGGYIGQICLVRWLCFLLSEVEDDLGQVFVLAKEVDGVSRMRVAWLWWHLRCLPHGHDYQVAGRVAGIPVEQRAEITFRDVLGH
jgi:hypothetical protein